MALTPIYYPDAGGPTGFSLTDYTDPLTYVAWCNYVISENLKKMEEAGLQWSDGVPDDLESAWDQQGDTLTQQSAILNDLDENANLSAGWLTRIAAIVSQITSLQTLTENVQNYLARANAITLIESTIATIAGLAKIQDPDPSGGDDIVEILKAAFLEELVPDSGVYTDSVLAKLKSILTSLQNLKYNDEILEIPATPRPIRIHLQGKTIQQ